MFIVADTCTMPVDVDGASAPFLPIVVKAHDWLPWAWCAAKNFGSLLGHVRTGRRALVFFSSGWRIVVPLPYQRRDYDGRSKHPQL